MDFTPGSKQRESVVRRAVAYAQAMEKTVLAELHGFGNEMLSALVGMWSEEYPAATIACACGEKASYQRKRTGQSKTLLGTIQLKRAYYLCPSCHKGSCPLDKQH